MLHVTPSPLRHADPGAAPAEDGAVPADPNLGATSAAHRPAVEREWNESEHLLHTLVNSSSDLIAVLDEHGQLLYANPATGRTLGYTSTDEITRDVLRLVHPDDREMAASAFRRDVTEPGIHPPGVYRVRTSTGGWRYLEVVATNCLSDPAIAGLVINARDVTESQRLLKALRTLGQANQVLVLAKDEPSLLQETCRTIVDAGDYQLAWVGFARDDEERSVEHVASAGMTEFLDDVRVTWSGEDTGLGPMGVAIRTGAIQAEGDLAHAFKSETNWAAAVKHGLRSTCVLPLYVADEIIGALAIYSAVPDAFGQQEIQLLAELSDALAYGIGRLRDGASLRASEVRFRALAAAAPVGILEISSAGLVTYANSKIAELSATEVDAFMGRGWLDAIHPEDVPALSKLVDRPRVKSSRSMVAVNFRIRRPDGEDRHVRALAAPEQQTPDTDYVVIVEDVTEELRAKEALTRQAYYDTLTGLANRALFLDRLDHELTRRRRDHSELAVLFVDLDRLKIVNDSLGHETGDALLREVGERFAQAIRTGDTAARFSGDEFIFLIRDVRDLHDAIGAAKRLLEVLESPILFDGHELVVTASVGIILPGDDAVDAATVVRDADTAMYQAKPPVGTATRSSTRTCTASPWLASRSKVISDGRSRATSSRSTSSRSSVPTRGGPSGPRRSCAGTTRVAGSSPRSSSCPSPRSSGSSGRSGTSSSRRRSHSWPRGTASPTAPASRRWRSTCRRGSSTTTASSTSCARRCRLTASSRAGSPSRSPSRSSSRTARRRTDPAGAAGPGPPGRDRRLRDGVLVVVVPPCPPVTAVKIDRSFIERWAGPTTPPPSCAPSSR